MGYKWLQSTLAAIDKNDWVIAVGHHEADKIDVADVTELLLGKIQLYLNGHTHAMKHYQIDGNKDIDWVTTGAGCMAHTHDREMMATTSSHEVDEVFYKAVTAFSVHTFSDDFSTLTTKFLDTSGATIHSFATAKQGTGSKPEEVVV